MFLAKDIMNTGVVSVGSDTALSEVANLIDHHRVSGFPVVDEEQRPIGVITEYDLLLCIVERRMHGQVSEVMQTQVVSVEVDTPLDEIARLILDHRVRRVPVTENGKLVGVISRPDLVYIGSIREQLLETYADLPLRSGSACSP